MIISDMSNIIGEMLTCSIVNVRMRCHIAWNSVIYKSKLLCGSINKHGKRTKNYVRL